MKDSKIVAKPKDFLSIRTSDTGRLLNLIDDTQKILKDGRPSNPTKNTPPFLQINLFYENSTRTQSSFEIAGKRLGGHVVNLSVAHSSVKKGESLLDTALTLDAMKPDIIVVRHPLSGAPEFIAQHVQASVVNAGDGTHEHPSQALLDAVTILRAKGRIGGLVVAICGDILHSRVARSNLLLLSTLGAEVRLVGPSTLMPRALQHNNIGCYSNLEDGLRGADVIMMLRIQHERMNKSFIPSLREYAHFFGLSEAKLKLAKPDAIVLHPGPMNRDVEIASSVADGPQSFIQMQVETGVAARMAILNELYQTRLLAAKGGVVHE